MYVCRDICDTYKYDDNTCTDFDLPIGFPINNVISLYSDKSAPQSWIYNPFALFSFVLYFWVCMYPCVACGLVSILLVRWSMICCQDGCFMVS